MNQLKTISHFLAILSTLLILGCDKLEEPQLVKNTPVFHFQGIINGEAFAYEAGVNDYYMHTNHSQDSVGIYSFQGLLGNVSCGMSNSCPNSISFLLTDAKMASDGNCFIEESLHVGELSFNQKEDSTLIGYRVEFNNESFANSGSLTYFWDFGDGTTSTAPNPIHIYDTSAMPGAVVCLTVTNTLSGLSSTRCNYIPLPENCSANFSYSFSGGTLIGLNATESGVAPYTYLWDFGSGFLPLSGQTLPDFNLIDSLKVCLKVVDAQNCEATICKTMLVDSSQVNAAANFYWKSSTVSSSNLYAFNEFTLVYTDANGKSWSSNRYQQPTGSSFYVNAVTDYAENISGFPTKAFEATTNCILFGESPSDILILESGELKFAVSHP